MKKYFLIGSVVIVLLLAVGVWQRFALLFPLFTTGEPVPLNEAPATIADGQPFGEEAYFVVVQIDPETYAIAEPRAWTSNFNYLILGEERALLFDAGIGFYDIRPVVLALTDLPLTFMPSHFHYDHTGQGDWERIAIVDVPHIRKQAKGNTLALTWRQHLGTAEGIEAPVWEVTDWIKPGTFIDLGGRKLELLYTPGHTDNSVSLYDREREMMFTGDFITPSGQWSAITPTASMGDFLQSAEKVLHESEPIPGTVFRGAHSNAEGIIPAQTRVDVTLLRDTLIRIRNGDLKGTGGFPTIYVVNESQTMMADPRPLQDWSPTYPDGHEAHGHHDHSGH